MQICPTGSCHNLTAIGKALRLYLNLEWQRKLEEGVDSVPADWAKQHPDVKHFFTGETMPGKTAQVPRQDNYCDCGLFVLAYMDFWTHAPPDQVELCERGALKGEQPTQHIVVMPVHHLTIWVAYLNARTCLLSAKAS